MKLAIIGATGAVGREMVADLEVSELPVEELRLFASPRSAGQVLTFRGKPLTVRPWHDHGADGCFAVLMSAGGAVSRQIAPSLEAKGITVIDNSSAWRQDDTVPLVVPEVNAHVLRHRRRNIIANPNCAAIQMVVTLAPLHERFGLKRVLVTTFQSVSGKGQQGIAALGKQVEERMRFGGEPDATFPQPMAFNIIPAIGDLDDFGSCEEEVKIHLETRKILDLKTLPVDVTTTRVPVFNCHSESVTVNLNREADLNVVAATLAKAPGVVFYPTNTALAELPSPHSVVGAQDVHVCRLRMGCGATVSDWCHYWVVADNLKKGAATNAVQILALLR